MRRFLLVVVSSCFLIGACGGAGTKAADAGKQSAAALENQREMQYNRRCFSRANEQAQAVSSGRYVPPQLYVHRWPKLAPAVKTGQRVKEALVAKGLADGRIRHGMIIARGGAGKTSLAKALEVELCDTLRTFLVHLQWDVARKQVASGTNPILLAMADALGAAKGDAPLPFLKARIGKTKPWLLLLDAFDEVSIGDRSKVAAWVNALNTSLPDLRTVVFSRPPVFDATYGLTGIDAIAEIPPLSCATVDRSIVSDTSRSIAGKKFLEFLGKYRLNVAVRSGKSCYYPHMSTWRDLGALRHIARMAGVPAMAKRLATRGIQSRASIYEAYLITLLQDDVQGTTMSPHDTLAMVDAMVKKSAPRGTRGFAVKVSMCVPVARGNGPERKAMCETLLQSALFRRTRTAGWFRLANQTLTDLFLARKIHSELPPQGGDGCGLLRSRAKLFESTEIGAFLLGMPRGRECLPEVTGVICSNSSMRSEQLLEIARGLPPGSAGYKQLVAALKRAKQDSRTPKCAIETLTGLEKQLRSLAQQPSGLTD